MGEQENQQSSASPSNIEYKKSQILIVGDLFIDENWLMARSENYHSTNVGHFHYGSTLEDANISVLSLCGIASVMKILGAPDKEDINFINPITQRMDLLCIGSWNPNDEMALKCILCPYKSEEVKITPFTLTGLKTPPNNDKELICHYRNNNSNCEKPPVIINLLPKSNTSQSSTHRIYRVYEGYGSDQPRLLYRYDWKLENEYTDDDLKRLENEDLSKFKNVEAIIIVDHGWGVITPKLIERLYSKFHNVPWYVRMKLADRPWMEILKEKKKRLRLIVTDEQFINYFYGVRVWRQGGKIGRGSLEILGELMGLNIYKHGEPIASRFPFAENVAILFEDNSAIAGSRITEKDEFLDEKGTNVFYIPPPQGIKKPIQVGRTSVFFNTLLYADLNGIPDTKLNSKNISINCGWALNNMYRWTKECTDAWTNKKPADLSGPFNNVITWPKPEGISRPDIINENYQKSWDEWNESSKYLGIIKSNGPDEIQLWRAFGTISDYICPGGEKRTDINTLLSSLNMYLRQKAPNSPFNCLFLAEPGWGKSYLAKTISDHFNLVFLEYSIAQMASTADLTNSFKDIVSAQKRTDKKILVFMDEVDADLAGHPALGLLIGPMWEGLFRIEGKTNQIEPCVWIFASTKPVATLRERNKGRDFLSRINGEILNLDCLGIEEREKIHENAGNKEQTFQSMINSALAQKRELRTEVVYHGINLLNRIHGPITHIDKEVLKLFYNIRPVNGVRSLGIFISKFEGIKKGKVVRKNVPRLSNENMDRYFNRYICFFDDEKRKRFLEKINDDGDKSLVRIRFRPDN
jgi:hypothetical protein